MKPETQMTCEEVRADLPLFVGGDLFSEDDGGSASELQRRLKPAMLPYRSHLSSCVACTEELAALKRSRDAFLSLGVEVSAPGLWPDVRAVLAAEGRLGEVAPVAPVYRFRRFAAAAVLACCGALLWMAEASRPSETGGDPLALESSSPPAVVLEAIPSRSLSLRPLMTDELALSEGAEIFGLVGAGEVATPLQTPGGVSAAGMIKIR
jgi:hypothetical protein